MSDARIKSALPQTRACRFTQYPLTAAPPGEDPIVDPWELSERFPGLEIVIDAGECGTIPTTVVDLSEGDVKVVREGAGPLELLG